MLPFDRYPDDGISILPKAARANTRREDAPRLQRLTGQYQCAYCGTDLIESFERWLLTSIDPRMMSTIEWARVKPSPAPPNLRVVEVSTC